MIAQRLSGRHLGKVVQVNDGQGVTLRGRLTSLAHEFDEVGLTIARIPGDPPPRVPHVWVGIDTEVEVLT